MSTYVPIQAITLSSPTTSVTFSGIPQTYTDLVLVCSVANSTNQQDVRINVNGDSGTNYSFTQVFGTGSSASSNRGSNYNWGLAGYIGTTQSNSITHFQNYSNTTTNKTMITRYNDPANLVVAAVSLWRSTAAINQIVVSFLANNFVAGSTFTLYGVGSGSPKAFGGDEVRTDGTYWYHIFRSSGRFEPVENLSNVDYLVVAGGGAGGGTTNDAGGGGGAGGYRTSLSGGGSALSLTANTVYPVTVGAGGSGVSNNRGGKGSNSIFASITSTGGGGGGGSLTPNGQAGGSGGGGGTGGGGLGGAGNEGGYSPVEGFAGANSYGGGGGASGAATNNFGANGVANSISGTSVFYAGGGGSLNATASLGGGGRGEGPNGANNMTAGTANTGGGGGATWGPSGQGAKTGMAGGSGIVIVRYAV